MNMYETMKVRRFLKVSNYIVVIIYITVEDPFALYGLMVGKPICLLVVFFRGRIP